MIDILITLFVGAVALLVIMFIMILVAEILVAIVGFIDDLFNFKAPIFNYIGGLLFAAFLLFCIWTLGNQILTAIP